MEPLTSLPKRVQSKIEPEPNSGCWLWTGSLDKDGYARVSLGGKGKWRRAQRAIYELLIGKIPNGLVLDHLCRNRACVNPEHLEPVSNRVNVLRGVGVAAHNAQMVKCIRGHYFDAVWGGQRGCRTCSKIRYEARKT